MALGRSPRPESTNASASAGLLVPPLIRLLQLLVVASGRFRVHAAAAGATETRTGTVPAGPGGCGGRQLHTAAAMGP